MGINRTLIAEIGGNHEGDFGLAKEILFSALETDVEVVKFQIYTGDSLVNKVVSPSRNQHFKKFALMVDQYHELAEITEAYGKEFNASIWDINLFKEFDKYLKFIKIGSGDMTNYPLLRQMASTGLPMVLSTGLATYSEVQEVVSFLKKENGIYKSEQNLCILQCTSMYPIPKSEANLHVLSSYRDLGVSIGYSDHTIGIDALATAYSLGAHTLEFHFTLEKLRSRSFRDHKVSLTAPDVEALIHRLYEIDSMLGDSIKRPTKSEVESGHLKSFRRGVYLKRNFLKGEIVSMDDLVFLRPQMGISAKNFELILNKRCKIDLKSLDPLSFDNFE